MKVLQSDQTWDWEGAKQANFLRGRSSFRIAPKHEVRVGCSDPALAPLRLAFPSWTAFNVARPSDYRYDLSAPFDSTNQCECGGRVICISEPSYLHRGAPLLLAEGVSRVPWPSRNAHLRMIINSRINGDMSKRKTLASEGEARNDRQHGEDPVPSVPNQAKSVTRIL
ncbi:hypothetical protein M430DRAFT_16183 [Amorphotheca resinae ATCC 22711]|uniref:Uncharacterized protein n=1 Tax=Amorphotheca resinae ATCC 22711 TaxID=857342 RepID=A0A2T3BB20_AMORE|nr:hypothetical protein M430DRAFT_16183 [Amorphotheca resinae ATCC 22711]PSS25464.1 hypothetical protein M430DRAFT_16183 [Amorphotheca resinae ATCC 22711]